MKSGLLRLSRYSGSWDDIAEIRSLVVDTDLIGKGYGKLLVQKLIENAELLGMPTVIALTYRQKC